MTDYQRMITAIFHIWDETQINNDTEKHRKYIDIIYGNRPANCYDLDNMINDILNNKSTKKKFLDFVLPKK